MDLALTKAVTPTGPELGNAITYTLAFSNPGSLTPTATCVITDTFPAAQVISTTVISSGVPAHANGGLRLGDVAALAPGQGGVITITGVVSPGLTDSARFTNTAVIDVISGTLGDVDLTNNSDAAVVAVSNLPPVAAGDAYTTDEDVPLVIAAPGVLGNDSDGDADPLAAVLDAAPSTGELTLRSNGAFTYTPALDFNGVVSFTYHASDGAAASNSAVVTLTVNSVPTIPALPILPSARLRIPRSPSPSSRLCVSSRWRPHHAGCRRASRRTARRPSPIPCINPRLHPVLPLRRHRCLYLHRARCQRRGRRRRSPSP